MNEASVWRMVAVSAVSLIAGSLSAAHDVIVWTVCFPVVIALVLYQVVKSAS